MGDVILSPPFKFRGIDMQYLDVIEHANSRVLTTPQIAQAFGTSPKVINRNFQRNKEQYHEDIHFFALTGERLKAFKGLRQNDVSLKFVSVIYLWTEKGAWLHAKSINNEQAWKAYQTLIDGYYKIQEQIETPKTLEISYEQFEQFERRMLVLEEQVKKSITLHSGEQIRLRKAVGERVSQLTTKQAARPVLFRAIYSALKERYQVPSYRDIKQHELQDALKFVYSWGSANRIEKRA